MLDKSLETSIVPLYTGTVRQPTDSNCKLEQFLENLNIFPKILSYILEFDFHQIKRQAFNF